MSSPVANVEEEKAGKITFRFCRECANMLYPKEDFETNTLEFACKTCSYTMPAETACVFRHQLSNTVGATSGVTQDVAQDPTLPRINKKCPKCGESEAVFFQSQQRTAETGMQLYYVCCSCGVVWQIVQVGDPKDLKEGETIETKDVIITND